MQATLKSKPQAALPAAETRAVLLVDCPAASSSPQPVTVGVPLARGLLNSPAGVALLSPRGKPERVQAQALAHWPDGSIRWLLLDFVMAESRKGVLKWSLAFGDSSPRKAGGPSLEITRSAHGLAIDTGAARFSFDSACTFWPRIRFEGTEVLGTGGGISFRDCRGRKRLVIREQMILETAGPVRATVRLEGRLAGLTGIFWIGRMSFYAGTGLVQVQLTIRNTRPARHRRNLWDLGDSRSLFFRDLSLELPLATEDVPQTHSGGSSFVQLPRQEVRFRAEPGHPFRSAGDVLEIYQDSSGGDNWRSRNHVNHKGEVPCSFRGYRIRSGDDEVKGARASPVVAIETDRTCLSAALVDFWQQFPKAVEVEGSRLSLGLFPRQWPDLFELQGGEQKTHTLWLSFDPPGGEPQLGWVQQPVCVQAAAEWVAASGVFPDFQPASRAPGDACETILAEAIEGPRSLAAKREIIDEYGWRNYGDVYADHEAAYYQGPPPVVSHYNNQYDLLLGLLRQGLRTGDRRWTELAGPLARHVIDIDVYHAQGDRAAYRGGLFWHSDHYRDAAIASHRAYSRANAPRGKSYGGGPSNEHNYASGLALFYYLTGDPLARETVLDLADWVIRMDDGRRTILGLVDDGPTGLASSTFEPGYHGPGRGAGNSVAVLLDAWQLSGKADYLDYAEKLIQRVVHPQDPLDSGELLLVEKRWSYTVFLVSLWRYLHVKAELGQIDERYAYARACLLHYAAWMRANERPYLDHPEELEYPTETWAAQELRKANVLRLAAAHADEPLAESLRQRGRELAARAWTDLLGFESRHVARAIALVLAEGTRDAFLAQAALPDAPRPEASFPFGQPQSFVPQRRRVMEMARSPGGILRACARLVQPGRWRRFWRLRKT